MSRISRLQKPDALFGRDRSAQVAFSGRFILVEQRSVYNASDDLDRANTDLPEKTLEVEEIELGFAERLKSCLDENQEMRREMEMSLLSQVEAEQNLKKEMEGLLHIVEEKDKIVMISSNEIVVLDEELMRT
ncbi:hypothetical protein Syun_003605 [Stephania yunnanensis]|uniref:Uncharacterized protein n=1 Tax=Stephania yunnanensis TaxID=152371 RepID=A0AAP0L1H2_9MAGN